MHFTNIARKYENVRLWMKTVFQYIYIFFQFCWMNFSLFCPVPHSSSPKLLSLSSVLLTATVSLSSYSQSQFFYPFPLPIISFQSLIYSLLANHPKYLDSGLLLSFSHFLTQNICLFHTFRGFIFCVWQDASPSEIKTCIVYMKAGI